MATKKSIFYRHPWLYTLCLQLVHNRHFATRYKYMTRKIKKGESVLEPACGPAILADYLPQGVFYYGFDLNKEFIEHAKQKGRQVAIGDALDKKSYKTADYVIAVDILHHLPEDEREKFIKLCFEAARKSFIICEPAEVHNEKSFFYPLKKFIIEWFEQDGQNDMSIHSGFEPKEYEKWVENGFNVIEKGVKRDIEKMGTDTIVTFYKTE